MTANIGKRILVTIHSDPYNVIVTNGPDGWQVDCDYAGETDPKDIKLRGAIEIICAAINSLSAEVRDAT